MAMTTNARAQAVYDSIASYNTDFNKLSDGEKTTLLNGLKAIWGADLTYIKGNADVLPTALSGLPFQNPIGQAVATAGSATNQTGTTVAPSAITGKGSLT